MVSVTRNAPILIISGLHVRNGKKRNIFSVEKDSIENTFIIDLLN